LPYGTRDFLDRRILNDFIVKVEPFTISFFNAILLTNVKKYMQPNNPPLNLPTEDTEKYHAKAEDSPEINNAEAKPEPTSENTKNENLEKSTDAEPSPLKKWTSLFVLSLALAIIVIDSTLLNVSFGTILKDLNTTIRDMQWVITGYALILAAFTVLGGKLGDLYGRKKMFVVGAIIFAIGSFVASISHNVGTLIAGEAIIEGIGAVLMLPSTASLIVTIFKGRERAIAFGFYGAVAAASSAIGPIFGGYLTSTFSWRWGFRINVVVAAILVAGSFLIKESKDTEHDNQIDEGGVLLSAVGLLSIVYAVVESSQYGWIKAKQALVVFGHTINLGGYSIVIPALVYGLIVLVLFVLYEIWIEKRGRQPLVSMGIFNNRQFTTSILVTGVMTLSQAGLIFSIPIFLQSVRGLDAFHTGLALLPLSIGVLIAAPLSGYLSKHIKPKYLIQAGLVLTIASFIILYYQISLDTTVKDLIPALSLFGIGFGLFVSQTSNLSLSAVPPQKAGEASGLNNTFRQLGQSLGTAIIGAVILSTITSGVVNGIQSSSSIPDQAKSQIVASVPAQISAAEFGVMPSQSATNGSNEMVQKQIISLSHSSTVDGSKDAFLIAIGIALLGFVISFFLPNSVTEVHADGESRDQNSMSAVSH
jgi:EmrB/QacA subfamily drug resistance transporter